MRRRLRQPIPVRVIRYRLDDPGRPGQDQYVVLTTILDPVRAPATALAALHPQRWECESVLDEIKTHQRGATTVVLAGRTPTGIQQELYAHLLVHHALRALMAEAAADHPRPVDCDRLSFTTALRAARRSVTILPGIFSPEHLLRAWHHFRSEVTEHLLPPRRLRSQPRAVKRKMSNYQAEAGRHRNWHRPTRSPREAIAIQPRRGRSAIRRRRPGALPAWPPDTDCRVGGRGQPVHG
ncbi:hypothetical protein GCM10010207_83910 [Streptomyces atratus]|uniref:hypothetical protein n=1 Tax=Streptomyces atratus TaxID=1893 RepID=UPI00166FBAE8|nr:hypothetical protein [Streptomyces atratus]GGT73440.1 hypothetical protein GCM10010207_83910 [Streptomyces atratus]